MKLHPDYSGSLITKLQGNLHMHMNDGASKDLYKERIVSVCELSIHLKELFPGKQEQTTTTALRSWRCLFISVGVLAHSLLSPGNRPDVAWNNSSERYKVLIHLSRCSHLPSPPSLASFHKRIWELK